MICYVFLIFVPSPLNFYFFVRSVDHIGFVMLLDSKTVTKINRAILCHPSLWKIIIGQKFYIRNGLPKFEYLSGIWYYIFPEDENLNCDVFFYTRIFSGTLTRWDKSYLRIWIAHKQKAALTSAAARIANRIHYPRKCAQLVSNWASAALSYLHTHALSLAAPITLSLSLSLIFHASLASASDVCMRSREYCLRRACAKRRESVSLSSARPSRRLLAAAAPHIFLNN